MVDFVRSGELNWILNRAFGGGDVADSPQGKAEDDNKWPRGLSSPSASECCDLLKTACESAEESDVSVMVFLIGGAGNGKSYLARSLIERLGLVPEEVSTEYARRSYEYQIRGIRDLVIVNDATIPRNDQSDGEGDLCEDISQVIENRSHLLACVNRGVLVGELRHAKRENNFLEDFIYWLLNGQPHFSEGASSGRIQIEHAPNSSDDGYYLKCNLRGAKGEIIAVVHASIMDHLSLLEPAPDISIIDGETIECSVATSEPILGGRVRTGENRKNLKIPIYSLYKEFFSGISDSLEVAHEDGLSPIVSNAKTLKNENSCSSLCSQLRAAEIFSGAHVTYRDAWGMAVLALTGGLPVGGIDEYGDWISERVDRIRKDRVPLSEKMLSVIELASRRTHLSIFSASGPDSFLDGDSAEQVPYPSAQVLLAMTQVDPLRGLDDAIHEEVMDALVLLDDGKGPAESLAERHQDFREVWSVLDRKLEEILLQWLNEENVPYSKRSDVLSWYGQYIFRLFSFAQGKCAEALTVSKWQEIWQKSKTKASRLRGADDVTRGLNSIVFPSFKSDDPDFSYFPVFSQRITPLEGGRSNSRFSVEIDRQAYSWHVNRNGDRILLTLKGAGGDAENEEKAQILLDFNLLKESLAQQNGFGFSDASIDLEPRLERLRAEVMSSLSISADYRSESGIQIVDGDHVLTRGQA
jgi:hypothetical protein